MKVLTVDRSAQMRRLISELLQAHFPNVLLQEAENSADVYHDCATFRPDLLIIDIYAPTMNGLQTLAELKFTYPHMIILVLSDFCSVDQRKHCLAAGADELLCKSDQLHRLVTIINRAWQAGPNIGALHHKRGRHELITGLLSYDQTTSIEHLIVLQMNQLCKEELLTTYDELLRNIWQSMLPVLGQLTLLRLVQRTCTLTQQQYAFMAELAVTSAGFNLCALADHIEQIAPGELRKGLQGLMTNFVVTLGQLNGNGVVHQLVHPREPSVINLS